MECELWTPQCEGENDVGGGVEDGGYGQGPVGGGSNDTGGGKKGLECC